MDTKFFYEEKYFDMVISSCGLLSGERRYTRIKEIAKHNVWLAARCKNTCVNEEEELVDILILRCATLIQKFNDVQSIIALLELEEYDVIHWLFTNYKKKKFVPQFLLDLWENKDTTISFAFGILSENMPLDVALNVFNRLQMLGYTLEQQSYNALLSRIDNNVEISNLIQNMKAQGVEPNAETYLHLMRHSTSFKESYPYFVLCNKFFENETKTNYHFIKYVYTIMLNKAETQKEVDKIYNAYFTEYGYDGVFELTYILKSIQSNNKYMEIIKYYNIFYENFISKNFDGIIKQKTKNKSYDAIINIFSTYLRKLYELEQKSMMYNSIIKIAKSVVDKRIKNRLKQTISNAIIKLIPFFNFDECKFLIEICERHEIKPLQSVFCYMLKYTKNNEQIEYIIDNVKISKVLHDDFSNNFFSNSVHFVIKYSTNECAEYLFNSLNEKQYPFNIIIYNILIKKLPFTQAIKVLLVMRNNGVRPDIYSIFPLLYKWKTIDELLNIIELASESHIFADSKCEQSLSNRIYELGCKKEIKMTIHKVKIEQSWKDALDHICNK